MKFVDLHAGSGWLSVLLKKSLPTLSITMVEASQEATYNAATNMQGNGIKAAQITPSSLNTMAVEADAVFLHTHEEVHSGLFSQRPACFGYFTV